MQQTDWDYHQQEVKSRIETGVENHVVEHILRGGEEG